MAKDAMKSIGVWAFIIGVLIALIVGIGAAFLKLDSSLATISAVMVILGLIVGILNVTEKETTNFIVAAIGLASGSLALVGLGAVLKGAIGLMLQTAFSVFGVFVAGAVLIPALKAVYNISKD